MIESNSEETVLTDFVPDPLGEPDMDAQGRKDLRANFGMVMLRMVTWEQGLQREAQIRKEAAQRVDASIKHRSEQTD